MDLMDTTPIYDALARECGHDPVFLLEYRVFTEAMGNDE